MENCDKPSQNQPRGTHNRLSRFLPASHQQQYQALRKSVHTISIMAINFQCRSASLRTTQAHRRVRYHPMQAGRCHRKRRTEWTVLKERGQDYLQCRVACNRATTFDIFVESNHYRKPQLVNDLQTFCVPSLQLLLPTRSKSTPAASQAGEISQERFIRADICVRVCYRVQPFRYLLQHRNKFKCVLRNNP